MRFVLAVAVALALPFAVPAATAHQCSGSYESCGACVQGEAHQHADSKGSCQSGPGFIQEANYRGASQSVPFVGVVAIVAALAAVALFAPLRRS